MRLTIELTDSADKSLIPSRLDKDVVECGSCIIGAREISLISDERHFSLPIDAVLSIRDADGTTLWLNPNHDEMVRQEILANIFATR